MNPSTPSKIDKFPKWLLAVFPLLLLIGLVSLFIALDPLAHFTGSFPPLEELHIQQVTFPDNGRIQINVINGGPDPVTISQTLIDDAYWQYEITPGNTLERLQQATISINYPWVNGEPLPITLLTSTGATFGTEVEVAVLSPQTSSASFIAFGLLGIYVGVIPVALGMMWYPFMRRVDKKWINSFLALTIGLLIFLFIDTILEALEIAEALPGAFQGIPVILFGSMFSLGLLLAISGQRGSSPTSVAAFIALGIGLHNFGEGLAIGASFATGAAALGSFLVIGFTLHNITEGVGIAAPLTKGKDKPKLRAFVFLALLAGLPAMFGAWIGGFAFNPFLAVLFLSLGAGAILQVIWEVGKMLWQDAKMEGKTAVSWPNLAGIAAGILIMYATAFLVKF